MRDSGFPTLVAKPGKGALDNPAFRRRREFFNLVREFNGPSIDSAMRFFHPTLKPVTLIAALGIPLQQEKKLTE